MIQKNHQLLMGVDGDFSLDFNGIDETFDIDNPSNFFFSQVGPADNFPYSIGLWLKMDTVTNFRVFDKGNNTLRAYRMFVNGANQMTFNAWSGLDALFRDFMEVRTNASYAGDAGTWVHWVINVASSGVPTTAADLTLYRNATAIAQTRTTGALWGPTTVDSGTKLIWGELFTVGGPNSFGDGKMAEMAVFDKSMSAAEVTEWYNAGVPFDLNTHSASANLIMYHHIQEVNPTQTDNSGSGNNGTMVNMTVANVLSDFP